MAEPFVTPDDVAARWRPLTDAETVTADALCQDASVVIRARFPGIDSQMVSGSVDPDAVVMVCANMVKRALVAPNDGVSQQSQTAGSMSLGQTFANPMRNVFLTAAEITAIIGYIPAGGSHRYSNTTIRRVPSVDDFAGWYDGGVTVIPANPGA